MSSSQSSSSLPCSLCLDLDEDFELPLLPEPCDLDLLDLSPLPLCDFLLDLPLLSLPLCDLPLLPLLPCDDLSLSLIHI